MSISATTREHISVINFIISTIGSTKSGSWISNETLFAFTSLSIDRKDLIYRTLNNACVGLRVSFKAISAYTVIPSLIWGLVGPCAADFLETSVLFFHKGKTWYTDTCAPQIILVNSTRIMASSIHLHLSCQTSAPIFSHNKVVTYSARTSNAWAIERHVKIGLRADASSVDRVGDLLAIVTVWVLKHSETWKALASIRAGVEKSVYITSWLTSKTHQDKIASAFASSCCEIEYLWYVWTS